MKTIALRFSDNFAPADGTINIHSRMISENGFVWYGKFGNPLSKPMIDELLSQEDPRFLLIKSGGVDRYWVYFNDIKKEKPEEAFIPEYYRNENEKIKCWFKITKIEKAPADIMSKCFVASTGQVLSLASKYSMSPYFIIKYDESEEVKNG